MLQYLLKNADFAGLFRFASPNFFKVVSPLVLMHIAGVIKKNKADESRWMALRKKVFAAVDTAGFDEKRPAGEHALEIFFLQILTQRTWILDFRRETFREGSWNPQPYYYEISPDFLRGVRGLYRGFYEDDAVVFADSLAALGLAGAGDVLREHLGTGDQTKVEFHLKAFQATFAKVFAACDRQGLTLHSDFFVLGLMLLGLYENLESVGRPQNVRRAFASAAAAAARKKRV